MLPTVSPQQRDTVMLPSIEPISSIAKEEPSTSSDEEIEEEEGEDEEEPKLKYQRIAATDLVKLLKKDSASSLAVSSKFLIIGTHWGVIYITDFEGNEVKKFASHSATVNSVSFDESCEYIASASDDGKVIINSLYNNEQSFVLDYMRPVKCVQLDPLYAKKTSLPVVSGGMAGKVILNEKGWFGHRDTILHTGEGPIMNMKWRGNLIAWADDLGVQIYDTVAKRRITFIDRPADSPRADLYKCRLCWRTDTMLLIGWADNVKIVVVKSRGETLGGTQQSIKYVEVIAIFQTDFIVSGIAPLEDKLLLLAYITEKDGDGVADKARLPEIRLMDATGDEDLADALAVKGYEFYQANDYHLEHSENEDLFYVLLPKDIILARTRDLDDRLTWLLERNRCESAFFLAQESENRGNKSKREEYTAQSIGQIYLGQLIEQGNFEKAAELVPSVLQTSAVLWERWVFIFAEHHRLKVIIPVIPTEKPQLSAAVYEMVLSYFLNTDQQVFRNAVKSWSRDLYDIKSVIVAVEDRLKACEDSQELLESLAELHTADRHPERAIEYLLRLRRPDVIKLIQENQLYTAIQDKAILLLEFDQHTNGPNVQPRDLVDAPAVQMLVQAVDAIPVGRVVNQLKRRSDLLFTYLDALYNRDASLGVDYQNQQVELYAEYDCGKLMSFLRSNNYYSLETAYKICEERQLVPEMVFILGRMGDNHKALMLIIEKLGDVHQAIEFAKEQRDESLWQDLLQYSLDKPAFIKGLLENIDSHMDPVLLVRKIPEGLIIPGLKEALLKVMSDLALHASLRKGCKRILANDVLDSTDLLLSRQRRGIRCELDITKCMQCKNPLFVSSTDDGGTTPAIGGSNNVVLFLCKHRLHELCLLKMLESTTERATILHDNFASTNVVQSSRGVGWKMDYLALLKMVLVNCACPVCRRLEEAKEEEQVTSKGWINWWYTSAAAAAATAAISPPAAADEEMGGAGGSLPPMVMLQF